ncbi:DUF1253-domain-containing protein, partial [Schizophyllum commune Loenen D]
MKVYDPNDGRTKLLTLLNVSALKSKSHKRKREAEDSFVPMKTKLNARKKPKVESAAKENGNGEEAKENKEGEEEKEMDEENEEGQDQALAVADEAEVYDRHWGNEPVALTEAARAAVERRAWEKRATKDGVVEVPEGTPLPAEDAPLNMEAAMSAYRDALVVDTSRAGSSRSTVARHTLTHVLRKRKRVLKNTESLAKNPDQTLQDQSFTRPSILILCPFRSFALKWFNALTAPGVLPDSYSVFGRDRDRITKAFGLPEGAVDKLTEAPPGTYPPDHVATFAGNVDDKFRVGVRITKRSVKVIFGAQRHHDEEGGKKKKQNDSGGLYGCDIILASPLGLRTGIENEKNADLLSSIEILVGDGLDVMSQQNWDHVKFVLEHLNQMPKDARDADFSRIRNWCLDGQAALLRQSLLFTAYETPEQRALFNSQLRNVEGKCRLAIGPRENGVSVPEGVHTDFMYFDCPSAKSEPDKRFEFFTTQVLPGLMKSAIQRERACIFVPSSFDYIRVQNHLRKEGHSFAELS